MATSVVQDGRAWPPGAIGSSASDSEAGVKSLPPPESVWARFEFETGKGNEGTKILMVVWDPNVLGLEQTGDANQRAGGEISWEGKTDMLSLRDTEDGEAIRALFWIPRYVPVPADVTVTSPAKGKSLTVKPLPAIYEGLANDLGGRGVLHTIFGKQMICRLQAEMQEEARKNAEGVALAIVANEMQRLAEHFGLSDPQHGPGTTSLIPQSPRSPVAAETCDISRRLGQSNYR